MPNNDYDDLFDKWGAALNVSPQLAKTVFHVESDGQLNVPDNEGAIGPMQMKPATAREMAAKLGLDPNGIDLHDMRWAVPLSMQYLADGLNATQSGEGALGYYSTGSADPKRWNQDYIAKATKLLPDMTLTPAGESGPPNGEGVVATAASLNGNDGASIKPFLQQHGQSLDSTRANWCAAFLNATLGANGIEGTTGPGKNVATSFLKWGDGVDGEPQAGDVLVQPKGHQAGALGGHVGIATGHVADGPGEPLYLMQSGNYDGKVAYSWEPASSVVVRRAPSQQQQATR